VITYVLGAPRSGKSTVARPLACLLPDHVVWCWTGKPSWQPAAPAGPRDIPQHRDIWAAYRQLIRAVLEAMAHLPVVLLGVCTPGELRG
jgi:adenosyl cobinamide kinase/adenosyl cobinamide phosphate guanylyltransferase